MITLTIYYTLVYLDIATRQEEECIILWEGYTEKIGLLLNRKGSGDRNRTCDTGLMSPLLYRLSYAALSLPLRLLDGV
jgi:hypothetical protein